MQTSQLFRSVSLAIGAFLIVVLFAPSSKADSTYTYTGNSFNQFGAFGGGPDASCPPQCDLTVSFTLATAIGPDANEVFFIPLSFIVKDGLAPITEPNATTFSFDHVSTNSSGDITGWNMEWITATDSVFSSTNPPGCTGCRVVDGSFTATTFAEVEDNPGTWSVSTTAPEPSSLGMLGFGLLGIIGLSRKKAAA